MKHTKVIPAWRAKLDANLKAASNDELLDITLNAQNADDYDGCFTARGDYERTATVVELKRRLTEAGFLVPTDAARGM